MPDHRMDNCPAPCCDTSRSTPTPFRDLYWREQQTSADLRRQLDELWHRFNAAGDLLTNAGIAHELEAHVALLAKIRREAEATNQRLELFRLDIVAYKHRAEDGELDLPGLLKAVDRSNEKAKSR